MTLPKRSLGALAVAAAVGSLAVPAGANAAPRTFSQIYPLASKICTNVAAGKASKRIQAHATEVLADCKALETGFTTAQTTMLTARTSIATQVAADKALVTASCPKAPAPKPGCTTATTAEKAALKALHAQLLTVVKTYFVTINANRHTFWTAVKAIPGEAHIKADLPQPVPHA